MTEQEDALEKLLARVAPEVPSDAAERVLARLDASTVAKRLNQGETERVARRAARWSALGLVLGLLAVGYSLHRTQGTHLAVHLHGNLSGAPCPQDAGPLAMGVRDERLLADPFFVGRK